ncbi:MAG: hypothetical protein AUF65_02245 [Chloroflexi bacterium 13_1_20CM_50_12]|nr:MAG: hypothetical protein AUF65_02245 [Chloroflexi bacterium 13_1_20CM_50_12]
MTELIVVEFEGENRIDSRLVAKSLGIEHSNFVETLKKYMSELEELGKVPFQTEAIGRTKQPQKFLMLNEDQAIFAGTLSRNTKEVVAFKLELTKKFSEARSGLAESNQPLYFNKGFHENIMENESRIPLGYWMVSIEMGREAWSLRAYQVELQHNRLPEGSAGKKWRQYLKVIGWDLSKSFQIDGVVRQGPDQPIYVYPDEQLFAFREWIRTEYQEHFETLYLPGRVQRKELT